MMKSNRLFPAFELALGRSEETAVKFEDCRT